MLIPYIVLRFFGIDVNTEKEKPKEVVKVNVEKNNLKKFKKYKESPNYDKEKTEEIVKPNIIEVRGAFQSSESSERDSSKDLTKPSPIKCIPFSKNTSFTIDLEMILEKGEDAPPILIEFQDNSKVIGVADGMGGAGGTIYNIDNAKRSGAYLATRAINSIAEKYFLDFKEAGYDISENNSKEIAKDLQYHFDSGLIQILNKINESGNVKSNIKSSMIKRLPTTFALSYIKNENNNIDIYNFWAGDSRIYAFGHVDGIHQLTIDDLRNSGDAYDNLTNDSPISNCINADKSYQINTNHIVVNTPVVLFAVTDGAFAYLQTPVHFERVVLETLNDSSNIDNWKRNLEKSFGRNQSDDISLSLTIVGYKNFVELKDSFLVRYKTLLREFEKLDEIVDKLKFQENRANQQNEAIHDVNLNVAECENAIVSANDKSNLLTRTINSLEYEIINSENQIERKKKEIKEIEKTIERKKEEIFHVNNEIGKIENEIDFQKNKLNKFKEKKNNIAGEGVLNELKLLKETNDKLRKELWYKYKEQYERYFINNKNENRTDN